MLTPEQSPQDEESSSRFSSCCDSLWEDQKAVLGILLFAGVTLLLLIIAVPIHLVSSGLRHLGVLPPPPPPDEEEDEEVREELENQKAA